MAVIGFDLDGTLVDSVADIAHALNTALHEVGLPPHPVSGQRGGRREGERIELIERVERVERIERIELIDEC